MNEHDELQKCVKSFFEDYLNIREESDSGTRVRKRLREVREEEAVWETLSEGEQLDVFCAIVRQIVRRDYDDEKLELDWDSYLPGYLACLKRFGTTRGMK